MDIALLSKNTLKIKGKKAVLVVDADGPVEANVLLTLNNASINSKAELNQLVIQGQGEYEVGGTKISVYENAADYLYDISIDGLKVIVTEGPILQKMKDKIAERDIVVVHASSEINPAAVTQLAPRVVVLYGEQAIATAKALGKENPDSVKKYQSTKELPTEMEVVVLA